MKERASYVGWALALAWALPMASGTQAQTRVVLFDGKTLAGWHTLGAGTWTVANGAIEARNPQKGWAHLVGERTFGNGTVRLKYLNRAGNSGLYVRAAEGGDFQVKGMQVDFGTRWDGAVMKVTDSTWGWVEEVTRASDSGWAKNGQWNELAVEMRGMGLKTYINGRLVWQGERVSGMAATGLLALQLHNGDANDIAYKDIEIVLDNPIGIIRPPMGRTPVLGPEAVWLINGVRKRGGISIQGKGE